MAGGDGKLAQGFVYPDARGVGRDGAPGSTLLPAALPGMPPYDPADLYFADRPGLISPVIANALPRVYVPNSLSDTVDVIDPATAQVVDHFAVGVLPQHVVPSWDLKSLWVLNDLGDSLTRIDPATGNKRETVRVKDPYNMYYTPDGKFAIVVAERVHQLDFREPGTMKLVDSLKVPCSYEYEILLWSGFVNENGWLQ